ncbi:hypothetical protein [Variovorax boronicumulans]
MAKPFLARTFCSTSSTSIQPALSGLFYVYTMHHSFFYFFRSMTEALEHIGPHRPSLAGTHLAQMLLITQGG